MPQADPQLPDPNSKSQRKRDMLALQKLGEMLLNMSASQFANIPLPDNLRAAIIHAKSLTSNEAKRRQLQYIGKLMREIDSEEIKQAITRVQSAHTKVTAQFHAVESWRDKLISHGDVELNAFLTQYPDVDIQRLRQLIRKAQHDHKTGKNTGGETALFRFLREIIG